MQRTIVVRRDYLHYVPKYNRYEKRHRNIPVHCSPAFSVKEGDIVVIGECRPLCKTVHFNVLKVIPNEVVGNVRKQFMLFWFKYPKKQFNLILSLRKQKIIIKKSKDYQRSNKSSKDLSYFFFIKIG